jgi:hypothetical protein
MLSAETLRQNPAATRCCGLQETQQGEVAAGAACNTDVLHSNRIKHALTLHCNFYAFATQLTSTAALCALILLSAQIATCCTRARRMAVGMQALRFCNHPQYVYGNAQNACSVGDYHNCLAHMSVHTSSSECLFA